MHGVIFIFNCDFVFGKNRGWKRRLANLTFIRSSLEMRLKFFVAISDGSNWFQLNEKKTYSISIIIREYLLV